MRPVDKGDDVPPYTTATHFTFAGNPLLAVQYIFAKVTGRSYQQVTTFPIADCLVVWRLAASGAIQVSAAERAILATAVKSITTKTTAVYKQAATPLVSRLGPFCSYCESPLSGLVEVEHCAPKSNYPESATSWDNFLLACGACNTAKSNTPSRKAAWQWVQTIPPSEADLVQAIREHYLWPDNTPEAWFYCTHCLESFTGTAWEALPEEQAQNSDNSIVTVDISTRTVTANIFTGSQFEQRNVRVSVLPTSQPEAIQQRTQAMIDLCALNATPTEGTTYDRRMLNRTLAWFTCLSSLHLYLQADSAGAGEFAWAQLLMTAVATGFYSIWFQIFYTVDPDLGARFVLDTLKPNYFPGTDVSMFS